MMSSRMQVLVAAIAVPMVAGLPGAAAAEDHCSPSRMLLVLDKSSSMLNPIGADTKWDVAVDALSSVAASYADSIQIGLSVFPGEGGECNVGGLAVAPAFQNQAAIGAALAEPPPEGGYYTPMAQSLDAVAAEPALNEADVPSYVVLITDGWQYCVPYDPQTRFAPVDAVERLSAQGITTFVVGFGDGVDTVTLNQMAVMAGTARPGCDPTGETPDAPDPCYYQADSPTQLVDALMDVAQQIPVEEVCDGLDNDCDGQIDEDLVQACSSSCGEGVSVCSNGAWSDCDAPLAETEICDGIDNDCDGIADELDEPLCGDGTCEDGQCVGLDEGDPNAGVSAGCGCDLGEGADPRTAMPLLLAFGFLIFGRRRRS